MGKGKKSILVIDDDPDFRYIVAKIIDGIGHSCLEASNLTEAKSVCDETPPHLILLDINLESESGQDFLKYRLGNIILKKIPIIVFSQENNGKIVMECLELGATDYLLKPLKSSILLQKITQILKTRSILSYEFEESVRPQIRLNCFCQFVKLNEVGGKVYSPIKIAAKTDIKITNEIIKNIFVMNQVFKASGDLNVISPGLYENEFYFSGVQDKVYSQIRKITSSWRTK